jgi:hypothetical protein
MRTRHNHRRAALALLCTLLVGCGHHPIAGDRQPDTDVEVPEECRAYLSAMESCMRHLSPDAPRIAQARLNGARNALTRLTDPAQLKQTCAESGAQLRKTCP